MELPPPRVFLSYSRTDAGRAAELARELELLGHDVWRDADDIRGGEAWRRSIVQGIRAADVVLLLLSPASAVSANVQRELDIADEQHRPVVPVLIEPAVMSDEMSYNLAGIQRLDVVALDAVTAAATIHRTIAEVPVHPARPVDPALPVDPSRSAADSMSVVHAIADTRPLPVTSVLPTVDATGPTGDPADDAPAGNGPAENGPVDESASAPSDETTATATPAPGGARAKRSGLVATVAAVVLVLVIGLVARTRGDGWHASPSPFAVPCRGLGEGARTAVKGQGATPKATVRSSWRNLRTGQHGEMDDTKADGSGHFRIGFECLPTEVGEAWTMDASDGVRTFTWLVNGVRA